MTRSAAAVRSSSGVLPPSQSWKPAPVIITRSRSRSIGPRDALVEHPARLVGEDGEDPLTHVRKVEDDRSAGRSLEQLDEEQRRAGWP